MLNAALSHFVAVRDRAVANLNNCLQNAAGVGEHVDLVGEVVSLVEEVERATSCITLINSLSQPAQASPSEE